MVNCYCILGWNCPGLNNKDVIFGDQKLVMQKTIGLILIVVGAIMLIWTGFSYTRRDKLVDAGPIHISADREHSVNWSPYAGGILVVGGILLVALARKTD
jgi:drug/metabolite transporter (DMT)-like permease